MKIETLSIDIETFSDVDLKKTGVYPYAESPGFDILLFGYSVNDGPVEVVDLACGEHIPVDVLAALTDNSVVKWAYNASFERVCLSYWLKRHCPLYFRSYSIPEDSVGNYLDPSAWRCSRVWGAYMGLPMSLKGVGAVLKLEDQKMNEGSDLIRYFCKPCNPTASNGGRTRNLPEHAPDKWKLFKAYNKRDVEVELGIKRRLAKFPVPESVWDEYHLDQEINDRGIRIDMQLVKNAIAIDDRTKGDLMEHMRDVTGLENPGSVSQMKGWLAENGVETDSLDKKAVKEILPDAAEDVADALSCRQMLAKASVSKYRAMEATACTDSRARGMFQFYGARTGRWAGRNIQLQNLTANHMPDLDEARALVRNGDFASLSLLYDNIPNVLSELIRTAIIPREGYKFVVADYSAIEARVLSFLAGEQWRIDLFRNGGDIYCQSASQMFKVPVVKNGVNGHLRQKGKIAELACIAEGQLVHTDQGLVPIEDVTTDMRVWDGDSWVRHEGVVYKGERLVMTYDSLTATPDHLVWVEDNRAPVRFAQAAAMEARLVTSGVSVSSRRSYPAYARVYDIRNAGPRHRYTVSGHLVHNCGYGGSVGALKAMGALDMGLEEEELKPLVTAWRNANPRIVEFWWAVDRAVKTAVTNHSTEEVNGFLFRATSGMLFIDLPSGRHLSYVKPRIETNSFGSDSVTYEGMTLGKWGRIESYGPKFVENLVQAVARDILAYAMRTLRHCFIVGSVHDELIIECSPNVSLEAICEQMGRTPPWIEGLLLRADGYECGYYQKS